MLYYVITFVKIMLISIYFVPEMLNPRKNIEKSDATHKENTADSTKDFNMVTDMELEEFISLENSQKV